MSQSQRLNSDWGNIIPGTDINVFGNICRLPDKIHSVDLPLYEVDQKNCTNSKYQGTVNTLGFSGYGRYVYPHGVVYEGYFEDGDFEGEGILTYPKGQSIKGNWHKGKLVESIFSASDGLEYDRNKSYLQIPDRTYRNETRSDGRLDIKLPGEPSETRGGADIPEGAYDTGNGYFRASTKLVYDMDHRPRNIVTNTDEKIIQHHFRRRTDTPATFHPELYEFWTSGRQTEYEEILRIIKTEKDEKNAINVSYLE